MRIDNSFFCNLTFLRCASFRRYQKQFFYFMFDVFCQVDAKNKYPRLLSSSPSSTVLCLHIFLFLSSPSPPSSPTLCHIPILCKDRAVDFFLCFLSLALPSPLAQSGEDLSHLFYLLLSFLLSYALFPSTVKAPRKAANNLKEKYV